MDTSFQASYDPRADWTAAPAVPDPDPLLDLAPGGPASFVANDLDRLVGWLELAGYRQEPARSTSEYVRLRRGRRLLVVYQNGTCLIQGAEAEESRALLRRVCGGCS